MLEEGFNAQCKTWNHLGGTIWNREPFGTVWMGTIWMEPFGTISGTISFIWMKQLGTKLYRKVKTAAYLAAWNNSVSAAAAFPTP